MSGRQVDRGRLADMALAAVVGALGTAVAAFDDGTTALDHALVALASAALAFHRAAPRAVLAVATVLGTAYV
ncbi:sensor histidine kinase, partial [Streptomyces coelicoflavus]|nr:sensor histidine kinase [Streptomyces coelicoflavus]